MSFAGFYNDASLIPIYLMFFAGGLFVMFGSVIFHECAHIIWFRFNKKRIVKLRMVRGKKLSELRLYAGTPEDYQDLTDKEYMQVNWCGVLFGFLPIITASMYVVDYWLLIIPYLVGSRKDIGQIIKTLNLEE